MADAPGGGTGNPRPGELRAGTSLKGRYRLTERIATGAQADTWTAHDEILDRTVLVRLLHVADGDAALRERFQLEALGVVRLSHPGVVAVYDTISETGALGLVLEQVQATPLSRFLHTGGAVAAHEAVSIALQVADALEAAHNDGVRHLNLSTDTVWLCNDQRVKVTDFGTVWHAGARAAPEPHRSAAEEERADVYSLGCLLRECLTAGAVGDLEVDALPEEVAEFLEVALADDPDHRFATVTEARSRLAAAQSPPATSVEELPAAADIAGSRFVFSESAPSPIRPERRPRRRRRGVLVTAIVALVTVALVMTLASSGDDPPPAPPAPTAATDTTIGSTAATGAGRNPAPVPVTTTAVTGTAATAEAVTTADVSAGVAVVSVRVATFRGDRDGSAEEVDALRTLDGEESTYWTTAGLGAGDATVNGVGLVFRLAEPVQLSAMTVTSDTRGWTAAVYTAEEDFDRLSDWGVLFDQQTNGTGRLLFDLAGQEAGAVLLWIPDPRAAVTEEIRIAEVVISAADGAQVR